MQRLHEDDLTGHLLRTDPNFRLLKLPLIAEENEYWRITRHTSGKIIEVRRKPGELLHPAREGKNVVEARQASIGTFDFASQYQQNPAPLGGGMIKKEWMQYYDELPRMRKVVVSWDTGAKTSDTCAFSACVFIGQGWDDKYYLLSIFRERHEFPALVERAKHLANVAEKMYPGVVTTLIEDASSGIQLYQSLKHQGINAKAICCKGTKQQRFDIVTEKTHSGQLLFPRAPKIWFKEFEHEFLTFPRSRFKDQCDAISQALKYLDDNISNLTDIDILSAICRPERKYTPSSEKDIVSMSRISALSYLPSNLGNNDPICIRPGQMSMMDELCLMNGIPNPRKW